MNDAWNEWQTFKSEGKKYLVSPVKGEVLKWKDAKAKCEEKGGILASNLSPKWFKKFPEKIKLPGQGLQKEGYWVGAKLTGTEEEHELKWITGEPLSPNHPNWDDGRPDFEQLNRAEDGECCVWVELFDERAKLQHIQWCDVTFPFICQLN